MASSMSIVILWYGCVNSSHPVCATVTADILWCYLSLATTFLPQPNCAFLETSRRRLSRWQAHEYGCPPCRLPLPPWPVDDAPYDGESWLVLDCRCVQSWLLVKTGRSALRTVLGSHDLPERSPRPGCPKMEAGEGAVVCSGSPSLCYFQLAGSTISQPWFGGDMFSSKTVGHPLYHRQGKPSGHPRGHVNTNQI